MRSPRPSRPASIRGLATRLALPVTLAVAGLAVVATQPGPSAPTDPDPIAAVRAHLASAPQDAAVWARLGALELRQAAETHDPRHYPDADAALTRSLLLRPDGNTAALAGLAALRTAQHRFGESHDLARRALALDSQDPAVWGTLADAAGGLGHDDDARDAVAHMLDLRPDTAGRIRSASLDELSGRVDVARATLEQAVAAAASPRQTTQVRAALAELAFASGDPAEAQRQIQLARAVAPDDPDLLAGQADAEAALGATAAALADYRDAVDRVTDTGTLAPAHLVAAGELFEAAGHPDDARRAYARFTAVTALAAANGVPYDTESALFAADRGDPTQALRHADAALLAGATAATQDAYGWALMANGRGAEALTWADKATSTGVRSALFTFHKGMIESSLDRADAARADLATALRIDPWFSPRLAPLARVTLTALSGPQ